MNSNSYPAFSITVPTYNRAHLLPRSISSILAQTFAEFELIIVDDGSTDNTDHIVKSFTDARIKFLRQPNSGAATARNLGASISTGKYITFLDSDDEACPDWLEHLYQAFNEVQAEVVCCGIYYVSYTNTVKSESIVLPKKLGPVFDNQVGLFTHGGTYALKSEVYQALGGFAPGLQSGQHNELAMRLIPLCRARGWRVHNIYLPLIKYHAHREDRIRRNPEAKYQGARYVLEHHQQMFQRAPSKYANYLAVAGVNAARLGKYREACNYLMRSIAVMPFRWKNYGRLLAAAVPVLRHRIWQRR